MYRRWPADMVPICMNTCWHLWMPHWDWTSDRQSSRRRWAPADHPLPHSWSEKKRKFTIITRPNQGQNVQIRSCNDAKYNFNHCFCGLLAAPEHNQDCICLSFYYTVNFASDRCKIWHFVMPGWATPSVKFSISTKFYTSWVRLSNTK
jgi:hypothetical protein